MNEAQEVQREALDAQTRNLRDTASLLAVVLSRRQTRSDKQTLDRVVAERAAFGGGDRRLRAASARAEQRGRWPRVKLRARDLLAKARSLQGGDDSLADGKDLDAMVVAVSPTNSD